MDSQKQILLIDSDIELGNAIKRSISGSKYKLIVAENGVSGIQKVFYHHPDLILYNSNIDPDNNYEFRSTLRNSTSFNQIPIIFFKDKEDETIKQLLANDMNAKSVKIQDLGEPVNLHKITAPRQKHFDLQQEYDFSILFQLSSNGIFIFDEQGILSINQSLFKLLKWQDADSSITKLEEIFDKSSAQLIKLWMKKYLKGNMVTFSNQVNLKDRAGEDIAMNLVVSELKNVDQSVHFLGMLQPIPSGNLIINFQLANEILSILKRENIIVSSILENKITNVIKQRTLEDNHQKKPFFTKREGEVLRLSIEGNSIKVIADKLSISTRTVEKYRTKLMVKSGAKNIVEVIVFSLKNNLIKI